MSDTLIAAAKRVDILGTAARILADPDRESVCTTKAECLALAWAAENFWSVCIEAELLVRTLAMPVDAFTTEEQFALRDHTIQTQANAIARLMAAMRGETPKGEENGHDAG